MKSTRIENSEAFRSAMRRRGLVCPRWYSRLFAVESAIIPKESCAPDVAAYVDDDELDDDFVFPEIDRISRLRAIVEGL